MENITIKRSFGEEKMTIKEKPKPVTREVVVEIGDYIKKEKYSYYSWSKI